VPDTPPGLPGKRATGRLLLAALLLGVALRLRQYFHGRSLWLDEAMLGNNILVRGFGELLRPLDSDQAAPVLFLWGVKLGALLAGTDERVLRLLPLLGGLLLLAGFARVALRLLAPGAAALAMLLVSLSPMLIQYANELKPYGLDAMWAVLLALAALRLVERPASGGRWAQLIALGSVVAMASSVAPFLLAAVGAGLLLAPVLRRTPGGVVRLVAGSVIWAGGFVTCYLLVYRASADSAYMQRYWVPYFLSPGLPGLGSKLLALPAENLQAWFLASGGGWRVALAAALLLPILVGAHALIRRDGIWLAVLLLAPLLLAGVASAARLYPAAPRLLLFSTPALALCLAQGAGVLAAWCRRWAELPWLAGATAVVALLPGLDAWRQLREPYERESLAPLVGELIWGHRAGAAIYVYGRSVPAWVFYTTNWRQPDRTRVEHRLRLVSSTGPAFRHAGSRGAAVRAEGDSLRYAYRDWQELIGVPTGTGPNALGVNTTAPDPGWGDNEARRLRAAGGPEAWVVMSSFLPSVAAGLDSALVSAGGERVLLREAPGARLSRWVFR
jgi:hypothetical protein